MLGLNTKPAHDDRGAVSMSKKGTRRDGRKAAEPNSFITAMAFRPLYRAIKWRRSSDDTTVVAPFRTTREEALHDALHDYAPHARAVYEIECSRDGAREELTEDEYELAAETYHRCIEARDARGVWG